MRRRTSFKRDAGPSARVAFCVSGISRSPVSVIRATLPCPSADVRAPRALPRSGRLPGLAASPQHCAPRCWAFLFAALALGSVTGRSADTRIILCETRLRRRGARRRISYLLRISAEFRAPSDTRILVSWNHRDAVKRRGIAWTGQIRPAQIADIPEGRGGRSWFQPIPACPDPWIAGDGGRSDAKRRERLTGWPADRVTG